MVVDLGCGSGYFTLKLSALVGKSGRVLAEDIRRFPLVFLWFRTLLKNERNVEVLHGHPNDPHLTIQSANAVLIANTYHEFTDSHSILVHLFQSLTPGGHLVVVDRSPHAVGEDVADAAIEEHEISVDQVEGELRQAGFEIVDRQDHFIENDPSHENWWLLASRRP